MWNSDTIQNPFGVSVFGSSLIRVEPDLALLQFAVSRLEQHPRDAFRSTREVSQKVQSYLSDNQLSDFGSSRISLSATHRYDGRENKFLGYTAAIEFSLLLRNLDRVEEVLSSVVDIGVNEIKKVEFQTSRLKELRAEARRRAVVAAREKAEIYCQAASVQLGEVVHIEDVNPEKLKGRESHGLHVQMIQADDEEQISAFNPGAIVIGGAVLVGFELQE